MMAVGFLSLGAAVVAAHFDRPTGYELSIYWGTTPVFWAGIAVAVAAALAVAFNGWSHREFRTAALVLANAAILSVLALPVIRSFFFYGSADSLDHLGWTRMIAGEIPNAPLEPMDLLYPGIHTTAVFVSDVMGVGIPLALQYVVLIFTVVFLVFVPLTVRAITDDDVALVVGSFSALLFLPINNVSVFNMPYPTSQALYMLAPVLFLLVAFVTLGRSGSRVAAVGWGVLLLAASLAVLFLHPIIALPVIVIFVAIAGLQTLYRWRWPDHPIASHRRLHVHAVLLVLAFIFWSQRFDRVAEQQTFLVRGLFFGGQPVGDEITRRAGSLTTLGGGLEELFIKIFLVASVFAAITGGVVIASLLGRIDHDATDRAAVIKYLSIAIIQILVVFAAFFLASLSVLPFRFLGVLMVTATVLGAVAITEGIKATSGWPSIRTVRTLVAIFLFVGLAAQMAHVHQSPYIYRGSSQVTAMQYGGYETAFEHRDPAVWWVGIRGGPERYVNARYGTTHDETLPSGIVFEGKETGVPFGVFGHNMTRFYDRDRYLPVSRADIAREAGLLRGLRYSRADFQRIETTSGVHRIQSNGELWVYYVDVEG